MPRRSAADISIVSLVPGKGRPEPPKELDLVERRAWNDVVDSLPGHWLDPAGQILLEQTAAEIALGKRLALRLRQMREAGDDDEALEVEARLAQQHQAVDRFRADGVESHPAVPGRPARRQAAVRAQRRALKAVGDHRQKGGKRWRDLVRNRH
jgi:hypothetical protein